MRSKIIGLGLASFFLVCCTSIQVKKQESNFYENFSFNAVWNAALEAVKDMGFTIKDSDKGISLPAFSEQKGYIHAEGEKDSLTQRESPQLQITIEKKDGRIFVDCQAIQPKQLFDYGKSRKNIKKFFELLNINLHK